MKTLLSILLVLFFASTAYGSSLSIAPPKNVLSLTATDVTVTNTTVETTIFSKTVPANALGTINSLSLTLLCNISDDGDRTITVRMKYGSTTLAGADILSKTGDTNEAFVFRPRLDADGTTSSQIGYLFYKGTIQVVVAVLEIFPRLLGVLLLKIQQQT